MLATIRPGSGAIPDEVALEPPHERSRGTHDRFVRELAFVESLDPRVEVGTGTDQALGGRRQLFDDRRVAFGRLAEPAFGAPAVGTGDLTRLDRALGQQPGDDVHDPGRDLERLAGEADTNERLERQPFLAAL